MMFRMMSLNQPVQTMIARDFSHNMEATLMVYGMCLNKLRLTMVARDFSLNMEVTLMFHMMTLHPLI